MYYITLYNIMDGHMTTCEEIQKSHSIWQNMTKEDREKHVDYYRKRVQKAKLIAFKHYSPELKCQKCGFTNMRALTIDHMNGNGRKHRIEIGVNSSAGAMYEWLIRNNYPEGYQVLCMNCQFIKRYENKEYGQHSIKDRLSEIKNVETEG
jgi:hypothetical protein